VEPWEEIPAGLLTGLQHESVEHNPLTYEYLEAGTRLISAALNHPPADQGNHPFLRWLSRAEVIKEVGESELNNGNGSFRYRWRFHADYIADLIAYLRWRRKESVLPLREPTQIEEALRSEKPSEAIGTVTELNLEGLFGSAFFPLQVVALAVIGSSDGDAGLAHNFYEEAAEQWGGIIESFLGAYGLQLRDEVTISDLVEILMAIGDGLALRELADRTEGAERARRLKLQATTAMALLLTLVDDEDPRTLAERTDSLVREQAGG
jgi:hypothetical protein